MKPQTATNELIWFCLIQNAYDGENKKHNAWNIFNLMRIDIRRRRRNFCIFTIMLPNLAFERKSLLFLEIFRFFTEEWTPMENSINFYLWTSNSYQQFKGVSVTEFFSNKRNGNWETLRQKCGNLISMLSGCEDCKWDSIVKWLLRANAYYFVSRVQCIHDVCFSYEFGRKLHKFGRFKHNIEVKTMFS